MVGIGTSDVNLDKYRHAFCSLLGKDTDSWGLSYTGKIKATSLCCRSPYHPYYSNAGLDAYWLVNVEMKRGYAAPSLSFCAVLKNI